MTNINLSIAGLVSSVQEVEEMKFISKVFLTSIHIHELVEKNKNWLYCKYKEKQNDHV